MLAGFILVGTLDMCSPDGTITRDVAVYDCPQELNKLSKLNRVIAEKRRNDVRNEWTEQLATAATGNGGVQLTAIMMATVQL
ncbi:unnamed protein product [Ceratitis capitata]|uniref:(Mediterranean fruit fly) hypothetical protein n=1 Tax=Ceratitis capitata TaxID=7213 RepID=A0A811V8K4_CERCA|nr:unnamed protein product [Ceratitis capitata]